MKARFAVATVAVVLASSLACQRAKDNKLPDAIRNVPGMIELARTDCMSAHDSGQKVVDPPKPDAEAHKAEVMKSKPQPLPQEKGKKPGELPKIKMLGPGPEPVLRIKTEPLPYKGSR